MTKIDKKRRLNIVLCHTGIIVVLEKFYIKFINIGKEIINVKHRKKYNIFNVSNLDI